MIDVPPNQTLQATAVKRLGWHVGCQRPAVPELIRSASWTLGGKRITPEEIDPQMHADDRRFIRDIRVIRG
jgi:hypothetical protein